jgi:hypothetical protein
MARDCLEKSDVNHRVKKCCAFVAPAGLLLGSKYFVMVQYLEMAQFFPHVFNLVSLI